MAYTGRAPGQGVSHHRRQQAAASSFGSDKRASVLLIIPCALSPRLMMRRMITSGLTRGVADDGQDRIDDVDA